MSKELLPLNTLSPGANLDAYVQAINGIAVLTPEQEQDLAKRLYDEGDVDAARQLVMTHLRFVAYVARSYSGYGLQEADLIQEGNVGLMKAVRRFDPAYGVRLVSFAVHWIKAEIHEFILKNWRIVKIATTKPQRKLFFNLRSAKKRLGCMNETEIADVARDLGVAPEVVRQMESRMASHDEAFELDPDDEDGYSPSQYLDDPEIDPATVVEASNFEQVQRQRLAAALKNLDGRSREIVQRRWLSEKKATLRDLADQFGISAERVRQLEQNALKKLRLGFV
ncbi:MAG: RNA polymerase sigma factor RpoH [Pseudomonadales bacterium]|nr:RNA polymerase sigma factor RpoH [Pseudomonadales bacterium]